MNRHKKRKSYSKRAIKPILPYILLVCALSALSAFACPLVEKPAQMIVSRLSAADSLAERILAKELVLSSAYSLSPDKDLSDGTLSLSSQDPVSSFKPAAGSDTAFLGDQISADPSEASLLLSLKPITAIKIAPISSVGYEQSGSVYIKNETNYDIDIAASLAKKINIDMSAKDSTVLILHTHGSESYSAPGKTYYTSDDKDRNTDNSQNVVAVGNKLEQVLTAKGIKVIHLTELFDYPDYNSAYNSALNAISEQIKKNPSIKVIIDLHRDAMVTNSGEKYKTVTQINGKDAAQMMFVCGSNQGVLPHSEWQHNLRLAIHLQNKINQLYPGLMRPINLRASRFNQHASTGSMLIEVGTSGNTLDEALYSAELFGNTLSDFLNSLKS